MGRASVAFACLILTMVLGFREATCQAADPANAIAEHSAHCRRRLGLFRPRLFRRRDQHSEHRRSRGARAAGERTSTWPPVAPLRARCS